jgi:hypothetical protein
MVTSKTFERLTRISPKIAFEAGTSEEVVKRVLAAAQTDVINRRRQPAAPPPEGGISQSKASRKYKIARTTILGWIAKGYIPIILRTKKDVFIDEHKLAELVELFKKSPGRGKSTIRRNISQAEMS